MRITRKNIHTGGDIPKIIHQIWIGKNVMPKKWTDNIKDFAHKYGYKYKLWTDSNVDKLDWVAGTRDAYDKMLENKVFSGACNIIRLLALYEYGGIYIDADCVITKPEKFSIFLKSNTAHFFCAWENFKKPKQINYMGKVYNLKRIIANSVIGSTMGHPFLKILLDELPQSFILNPKAGSWIATGPHYLYQTYMKYKSDFSDIKIYPMKFFYPQLWHGITDSDAHKKIDMPEETMMFQYGYSTNHFDKYFNKKQTHKNKN